MFSAENFLVSEVHSSAFFCFVFKAVCCRMIFPLSQNRNVLFTVYCTSCFSEGQFVNDMLQFCSSVQL